MIYGKFYEKFKTASTIGDVTVYEKGFNNDKLDFELMVRSKDAPSLLPEDQSQNGIKKSYTITSTNNYIGKSNWQNMTSKYQNADELFKGRLFDLRGYRTIMDKKKVKDTYNWGKKLLGLE